MLTIINIAEGGVDDEDDFLLNYEVCAAIPEKEDRITPTAPGKPPVDDAHHHDDSPRFGHIDFGPGCSNS